MTQDELKLLFIYKDGKLFWRDSPMKVFGSSRSIKGKIYKQAVYGGKNYLIHRLIYVYHYGLLPKVVDHINRDSADNRIENLRAATYSLNNTNAKAKSTNKSGSKNVHWAKDKQKWRVAINIQQKSTFFGYYDNLELADLVAIEARDKYHGKFACHAI